MIGPSELLVVCNTADRQSLEVASLYAAAWKVPADNLVRVRLPVQPQLSGSHLAPAYELVEQYIREHVPHVQAIALAWTLPWRVERMSITSAFTLGVDGRWQNTSGFRCAATAPSPLYGQHLDQPAQDFGVRPSMMLAGETAADVRRMVERAREASGSLPPGTAYLLRTADPSRSCRWPQMVAAAERFAGSTLRVEYLEADVLRDRDDVLCYFTGTSRVRELETLTFRPGAVADHLTSSGGKLLDCPQMSCLEWLRAGAAGSYGTVAEPCANTDKFPNVDLFLQRYVAGAPLIDAYWQSVRCPGEGVFVGDPLCSPFGVEA